jgi:hypothetical protein
VIHPQWDSVSDFSYGVAAVANQVERSMSWQLIDASGKTIIAELPPKDTNLIYDFGSPGRAPEMAFGRIAVRNQRQYHRRLWLDVAGQLHPHTSGTPTPDRAFAKVEAKPRRYGLIKLDGSVVFEPEFETIDVGVFSHHQRERIAARNWVAIQKGDQWGLANRNGEILVKPFVTSRWGHPVRFLRNGSAVIGRGNRQRVFWPDQEELREASEKKLVFVDTYGPNLIFRPADEKNIEWWVARQQPRGLWKIEGASRVYWTASLAEYDRIWIEDATTKRWHFCTIEGERLGPEMAEKPSQWFFDGGMGIMREGDACHFIDRNGKKIDVRTWEDARLFQRGLAAVKRGGKWGFIDTAGKLLIDCKFDEVGDFFVASEDQDAESPLLAAVSQAGRWGYIDSSGKVVIPISYEVRGRWGYGKIWLSPLDKSWETIASYEPDGTKYDGDYRTEAHQRATIQVQRHRHAGAWSFSRSPDGRLRGLVSDAGVVALENEWFAIVWVAPGVVAARNASDGGLFCVENGWLYKEDDTQRIMRDERGAFAPRFVRNGLVMIETIPKWGFARHKR